MRTAKWTAVLALAAAAACAPSAPDLAPSPGTVTPVRISGSAGGIGSTEIRNDPSAVLRTVVAPLDTVWRVLSRVYEALDIPQAGAHPSEKMFGNAQFRPRRIEGERLSKYIDCGAGLAAVPKADEYEITMSVLTRLAPDASGLTVVATTVTANGKPRAASGNAVYCQSKGALEKRLGDLIVRLIAGAR